MGVETRQLDFSSVESSQQSISVPWNSALEAFLLDGSTDVFLDEGKLGLAHQFVAGIISSGAEVQIVGKFSLCGALTLAGSPEVHNLNNELRSMFMYTGPTGDEGVAYLPELLQAFRGEWSNRISDIDLKVVAPDGMAGKLFDYARAFFSDTVLPMTITTQGVKIPSRKAESLTIEFGESIYLSPNFRLSVTPAPQTDDDTMKDRRWSSVNRIQQIKAKIEMGKNGLLEVVYKPEDICMIEKEPDSYYPDSRDPLDKILVTVSRMMASGSMRQQLGLVARHYQAHEMFYWDSIQHIKGVLQKKKEIGDSQVSASAMSEVLMNVTIASIIEPNMIRMVPEFGIEDFLPGHLQSVDWNAVAESSIRTWIYGIGHFPATLHTLVRVVKTLTGDVRFSDFATFELLTSEQRIDQNVMAMNWMLSGTFGI